MALRNKAWFQANTILGTTKLVLNGWNGEFLIVNDISDETNFSCTNHLGSIDLMFPYAMEWEVMPTQIEITDPTEQAIDESYNGKVLDGQAYYRKKRAQLVKKILTAVITEEEGDFIDVKTELVSSKLNTGDWKSALKRLNETTVEGSYTQEIKDEYSAEISSYIALNY